MSLPTYIPVRDDSGLVSLSINEREFIHSSAFGSASSSQRTRVLRIDGRTQHQIRPIELHFRRSDNSAVCTVQWGRTTRCTCTVTADLIPPSPDRPNEGAVAIIVDVSPSASTAFRQAAPSTNAGGGSSSTSSGLPNADKPQKLISNRILRCLERILVQSGGVLDQEALCVTVSQWVWKLNVSVTVLDAAGGNVLDAAVMACMAAIRHYRKPVVQNAESATSSNNSNKAASPPPILLSPNVKEPTPLPLHHTPLAISCALLAPPLGRDCEPAFLMDPNAREELCQNAALTYVVNVHGEICLVEFSGGIELPPTQLRDIYTQATAQLKDVFGSLEESLQQADERALQERLQLLQEQHQQPAKNTADPATTLPPLPEIPNVPFYQQQPTQDNMDIDNDNTNDNAALQAQNEAEEAYRRKALDYNLGHVASKVRDDKEVKSKKNKSNQQQSSNLLAAMLKSVSASTTTAATTTTTDNDKEVIPNEIKKEQTSSTTPMQVDDAAMESMEFKKETSKPETTTTITQSSPKPKKVTPDSDDEEEETLQLKSEFQEVQATPATSKKDDPPSKKEEKNKQKEEEEEEEEVDDLAAAIKKKKKKSKKSKK